MSEFTDQSYDRRAMEGETVRYELLDGRGTSEVIPAEAEPLRFTFPPKRLYFEDLSQAIGDDVNQWRPTAP